MCRSAGKEFNPSRTISIGGLAEVKTAGVFCSIVYSLPLVGKERLV